MLVPKSDCALHALPYTSLHSLSTKWNPWFKRMTPSASSRAKATGRAMINEKLANLEVIQTLGLSTGME